MARILATAARLLFAALLAAEARGAEGAPRLTHGVAAGEVSASSAIVWGRCDVGARLQARMRTSGEADRSAEVAVTAENDFAGKLRFEGLTPATKYSYEVSCATPEATSPPVTGELQTAPAAADARPVHFIWSGDVGGQNVCRDKSEGYAVFDRMREKHPDFFVALGDMVYADDLCRSIGRYHNQQIPGPPPALDLAAFRAQWRYNREDAAQQRFFAATPYYAVWDDHEIVNDAGPKSDVSPRAPGRHLLPIALQAFVDYQPMIPVERTLYRSARWGKHLELFFLDTRQYRDANAAADDPRHPKTLLGEAQRRWLLDAVKRSDATWRVIVSSVPLSIPTGSDPVARDGWANFDGPTGFENEAVAVLRSLHDSGVRNQLWITTDVHFANVLHYLPFRDDPKYGFYEITTGPLSAGIFPRLDLDPTLSPQRIFKHAPADARKIASHDEAEHWFNFGTVDVAANGDLTVRIITAKDETVYTLNAPAERSQ